MSDPGGMTCLHGIYEVSRQVEGGLGEVGLRAWGRRLCLRQARGLSIPFITCLSLNTALYLPREGSRGLPPTLPGKHTHTHTHTRHINHPFLSILGKATASMFREGSVLDTGFEVWGWGGAS